MLSEQNIESELSCSFLLAIAARAAFACEFAGRHLDAMAVDALIHQHGLLAPNSRLASFTLHVQLKATRVPPIEKDGRFSLSLPLHQYNRLREVRVAIPQVLVVLFLPEDATEWLRVDEEGLLSRGRAYWVSLRGAAASSNATAQTIYVPRQQLLSPESLTDIMIRCSRCEELRYAS